MQHKLNEQIINYAEVHDSDEAEALKEALNYAEENDLPQDSDDIVQAAVVFLDVLVREGEILESEKVVLLPLVEYKEAKVEKDEADELSDSVDGEEAA